MPTPSTDLYNLRPDLAAGYEEFSLEMDRRGFIGLQAAPQTDVAEFGGTFPIVPIEQLLQSPDTQRSPGSGYARGKFTFTTGTYQTKENGYEEPVDENEARMYGSWIRADELSSRRAFDAVLRNHEKRVSSLIFNTTTFAGAALTTAISTDWTQYSSAIPIDDVDAAVMKVYDNSGMWPNTLIISRVLYRHLRKCDQISNLIASNPNFNPTSKGIDKSTLSQIFDLPNVLIAGGTKSTADAGQAATLAGIWDKDYAMVCHLDGSEDVRIPSLARTFHWAGDGSEIGGHFEEYDEPRTRARIIRVRHQTDEKLLYPELGHLLTGAAS